MKLVAPKRLSEAADSIGAAGYALVGLGGLIFVGTYPEEPAAARHPGDAPLSRDDAR